MKNDFIITEISTVGAFDNINNALIPFHHRFNILII